MPGSPVPWTADETETLLTMMAGGATSTQIAAAVGRSRSAVCARVHRIRISAEAAHAQPRRRGFWNVVELARLRRLAAARTNTEAIAADLGRSVMGVRLFMQRAGIRNGIKQHWSVQERDTLRALHAAGRTDAQIASQLGRSVRSVVHQRHWLRDQGLLQIDRRAA